MKIKQWIDKSKKAKGHSHHGIRIILPGRKPIARFFPTIKERKEWFEDFQTRLQAGEFAIALDGKVENLKLSFCIERFLDWARDQAEWRPKTIKQRRYDLERFVEFLGDPSVQSIERADAVRFIETYKANATKSSVCGGLVQFFNYASNVDQGRDWVEPRKFLRLQWTKTKGDRPAAPGILSPGDARKLMLASSEKYKAAMALALFTGIRPESELPYIAWKDIHFTKKQITIEITKTRQGRIIADLPGNLWTWLKAYKAKGLVIPNYNSFRLSRTRACRRAGVKYSHDAARHSFGSYGYWIGEAWCIRTMGHVGGTKTYRVHYVNNGATQGDAKKYFSIKPPRADPK